MLLILAAYLFFWPVSIDPVIWTPPKALDLARIYEPNELLASAERLSEGAGIGPEDVAVDDEGRIYGGVEDGRILRFQADGSRPEVFTDTRGRAAYGRRGGAGRSDPR